MKRILTLSVTLLAASLAALAQNWPQMPAPEPVPAKGAAVESVTIHTAVDDWGTVVKSMDVTVKNAKVLKGLKASDFDIINNVANTFYDPATGEAVKPYADDEISISVNGNVLTINARPFDAEGARNQYFRKDIWKVVCKKNKSLNFSLADVTNKTIEVIDDCIKGTFTYAGITREYALYLPKDNEGNTIPNVPLFVWQIGGGEYNQDLMTVCLANKCLVSLPQHNVECATLVFALANPNYSYSASLDPEKIKLVDRNNALQMAFIDQLIAEGKVDGSRLFCAGASSGGGCTMRFMMQFADRFKAALPICAMDPIVPIHMVMREKPETPAKEFADQIEAVWKDKCVYKWNGSDMELQPMNIEAFTKLPMYFVHAQDDNTCNVVSTHAYYDARQRLGAKNDLVRIYSDDEMRAFGFGGMLSHFSWCRVLNDYAEGEAMNWIVGKMALPQLGKDSIEDVIKAMTLEEKVNILHGFRAPWGTPSKFPGAAGCTYPIERLGIPSVWMADGPHRLVVSNLNTTELPSELTVAATFNPEAAREAGRVIGSEVSDYGLDVLLAPGINLLRNTLGGRNGEYYSEDPVHAGKIAAAFVNGIQEQGVGVALKHYAVNNQETNRNANDAIVSQRPLRELYLRNFEIAVKEANPWSIMTSYNKVNGEYVCESRFFNEDVLRADWGYEGVVMSDWNAGRNAVLSIQAGNDMLMPGQDKQRAAIMEAAKSGELSMELVNLSVKRVLEFVMKSHTFNGFQYPGTTDLAAHSAIARQIGSEGIVLLKNNGNVLPMESVKNVALYGTTSYDIVPAGMGFGATGHGYYCVGLVEGLSAAGYNVEQSLIEPYKAHIQAENRKNYPNGLPPFSITAPTRADEFIPSADMLSANIASNDLAIITLGRACGEGADRTKEHFYLTENETALIKAVSDAYHAAGKKVVVLLNIVSAIETASWRDMVDGILCVFQPGAETGNAIADVMSGKVNPSGRLPQTFQVNYGDALCDADFPYDYKFDMSAFQRAYSGAKTAKDAAESAERQAEPQLKKNVDYTEYNEGVYVGYRYFTTNNLPVSYAFGYGLSYTDFGYKIVSASMDKNQCSVTVQVTNKGKKSGRDVVQIYVAAPRGSMDKPARELKAFGKTGVIEPGKSETITLTWDTALNASYDESANAWELANGKYQIMVCKDAASKPAAKKTVKF